MIVVGIRRWNTNRSTGFTLIEIIVSLAILGTLAGLVVPLYAGLIDKARIETAIEDITTISSALTRYYVDHELYPETLDEVGYATYPDPWGNPYQYLNIQTAQNQGQMRKDQHMVPINSDYDLYSMGKDGQSQSPLTAHTSRDDIIRANDGAYIGPAGGF